MMTRLVSLILLALALAACTGSTQSGQTVCAALHSAADAAELAATMCDRMVAEGTPERCEVHP